MRRGIILGFIYHPAFISLIIWIVLILSIPMSGSRYRARLDSREVYFRDTYFLYCDLDTDGTSERVSIDLNDQGRTKIIVYKGEGVMDQYDAADMEMRVPRMLIHTFVENSVKYGLRRRTEGGRLKIEIRKISSAPGLQLICQIFKLTINPGRRANIYLPKL